MGLFKRITATFGASVENVVARVEDHDAIIRSAIDDSRRAAAKARAQLTRVRRDGERLRDQHQKDKDDIARWAGRALDVADTDEARALACIKRKQSAETRLAQLDTQLAEHQQLEQRLGARISELESRVGEISRQRNAMRSRQSAAEAERIVRRIEGDGALSTEETFERWEATLLETEMTEPSLTDVDPLEMEFVEQEEAEALRQSLSDLQAQSRESNDAR